MLGRNRNRERYPIEYDKINLHDNTIIRFTYVESYNSFNANESKITGQLEEVEASFFSFEKLFEKGKPDAFVFSINDVSILLKV